MRIPHSVKVGAVTYAVKYSPVVEICEDRNYQGACRARVCEIEILDSLGEQRKQDVFVHELVHAMLFEAGYKDHDEELVERLGKVLHKVLQDNTFTCYELG